MRLFFFFSQNKKPNIWGGGGGSSKGNEKRNHEQARWEEGIVLGNLQNCIFHISQGILFV